MSSDERRGADPRAPHWYQFNRVNDLPNAWTFEVLEWDDDPDEEGIADRGEAEVVRDDHRFLVATWLVPRERTHDRYWSVSYETVNQDDEPEPLAFHICRSQDIARNNLGHARDVLDDVDPTPHVLVRNHDDGPRETFEYPAEHLAEKAADIQIRLSLDDDRNYSVTVHSKDEWQERLEI